MTLPKFTDEQLDAAEKAVAEVPGRTAAQVAARVRQLLTEPGSPAPRLLPREHVLGILRQLEDAKRVRRERGQATVTFYPVRGGDDGE